MTCGIAKQRIRVRASRADDGARIVDIWREAVAATHHFLLPQDRDAIDEEVQRFLPRSALWLAVDDDDRAIGFMGLKDAHVDALFVDPAWHGVGVGRRLVEWALLSHPVLTVDVNEQNGQAVGFYQRLGFLPTARSPFDDEGRPYPLIHLRLDTRPRM